MATLSKPVGYECEFVDQVPEDYFCKQCKHVAREPTIASCCGETFCRACIEAVIQDKKPCSSCQENNITYLPHKKYQAKILALKVCCLLKGRGCEWTGQLQHLDAHLHLTTGDCVYVDVDCPSKCNQKVQKRNVKTHLANECLEREHTCRFCGFTATFCEVDQHLETCELYILDCPNRCGVSFERNVLEDHMKMCGLQKVQCDFSHTGCEAEFLRNKQNDHSEQNTQKHLALTAATLRVSQEQQQALEQQLLEQKQVIEEKDAQIKALQDQQKMLEKKVNEQQKEFQEKHALSLQEHESSINLLRTVLGLTPYILAFPDYQQKKAKDLFTDSPPTCTNPGGYKFKMRLWPNGLYRRVGSHVTVYALSLKDDKIDFPAKFTITLELLNQHRDQDHYTVDILCEVTKMDDHVCSKHTHIPHADLEWNADKQTQYLKNDCLNFRVKKIVMA